VRNIGVGGEGRVGVGVLSVLSVLRVERGLGGGGDGPNCTVAAAAETRRDTAVAGALARTGLLTARATGACHVACETSSFVQHVSERENPKGKEERMPTADAREARDEEVLECLGGGEQERKKKRRREQERGKRGRGRRKGRSEDTCKIDSSPRLSLVEREKWDP